MYNLVLLLIAISGRDFLPECLLHETEKREGSGYPKQAGIPSLLYVQKQFNSFPSQIDDKNRMGMTEQTIWV